MKSYAINRIAKDLIEFALVYDTLEFNELNDQVLEVINYNSIDIEEEDYYKNDFYCSVMANMVLDDIDDITNLMKDNVIDTYLIKPSMPDRIYEHVASYLKQAEEKEEEKQ